MAVGDVPCCRESRGNVTPESYTVTPSTPSQGQPGWCPAAEDAVSVWHSGCRALAPVTALLPAAELVPPLVLTLRWA